MTVAHSLNSLNCLPVGRVAQDLGICEPQKQLGPWRFPKLLGGVSPTIRWGNQAMDIGIIMNYT